MLLYPLMEGDEPVAVQVKSVPATLDVRLMPVAWLLHCVLLAGLFDKSGVGLTVTTYGVVLPLQPFA